MGPIALGYLSCRCAQVAVMDIRAIVLIGGAASDGATPAETIGGMPLAYLDVLGVPVAERVQQRLQRFGVSCTTFISDCQCDAGPFAHAISFSPTLPHIHAEGEQFWRAAEDTFLQYAEDGADLILALRVGPYVEADYEALIQHHLDHHCAVTMAVDSGNAALDLFVLSASARADAAALFKNRMERMRRECAPFVVSGYCNRLRSSYDLRRLAVDGLMTRNEVRPEGTELKPGVWVGTAARIHRKARVIAPAFIGAHAKVRASSLITRGSVIEHHADVDCGTVVENSSVLPFTRVGAGLDVMHSVVGFRRLAHLRQNVEVEIADEKFVGMVPLTAVSRLAGSAAALFAFIPIQIYRGLFASSQRKCPAQIPESLEETKAVLDAPVLEVPATGAEASEFPSNLAVARRYGDQ
jgi:carbonic anhydrase/acetyltransferase-like protein (isoleucine patch superfamily)